MNNIKYAGSDFNLKRSGNFEVLVNTKNSEIVVVPPLIEYSFDKNSGIRLSLEKATLPFKDVFTLQDDKGSGIVHAAKQAVYYFGLEHEKKEIVINSLGELIVSYLVLLSNYGTYTPVVENLKSDILRNLTDCNFSLSNTMQKIPLNIDYVRKLFQAEIGISPHEFLVTERMKLAKQIIASRLSNKYTAYSIAQIAESCGYSDPIYFYRVFKKYFGVSPKQYANNCNK